MKTCQRCKTPKPADQFNKDKRRPDGLKDWCRKCQADYHRAWRAKNSVRNKERVKNWISANKLRYREVQRKYREENRDRLSAAQTARTLGITPAQLAKIHADSGGRCAVCGTTKPGRSHKKMCVDRCHATGVVRGCLCHRCNRAIGMFKDDPELLRKAATYLERSADAADS